MLKTAIVLMALLAMVVVPVWTVFTHDPGLAASGAVAVGADDHDLHLQPEDDSGTAALHGFHDAGDHEQPGHAAPMMAAGVVRSPQPARSHADRLDLHDTLEDGPRRPPRKLSS